MERARRQAAGPLRVILEASKPRRKAAESEPPTAAAEASSVRQITTRAPAASPAPAPIVAAAAPESITRSVAAPPPVTVAPPPAVAPPVVTEITLSSEILQNKAAAGPVAALQTTGVASAAPLAAPLPNTALSVPAMPAELVRPKLVSRVDPELSQRAFDDMGRNAVVRVDMTIRADGSVAAVTPVGNVPRSFLRALVGALEQWRFEPLPQQRVHRVELVFNEAQ